MGAGQFQPEFLGGNKMSLNKEYCFRRLDTLWQREDIPVLDLKGNKYILFSDLHLGDGGKADDFCENEETLMIALAYYLERGFKLILVGDIEELWQFGLEEVRSRYFPTIYKAFRMFADSHRFRLYGNHDGDWNKPFVDPSRVSPVQLGIALEALKMKDADGKVRILICHGHQGDIESDREAWTSRIAVRLYRLVEPLLRKIGKTNPPAIRSQIITSHEKIFYLWAKRNKVLIICGHTHRAIFASLSFLEKCQGILAQAKESIKRTGQTEEQIKQLRNDIRGLKRKIRKEKKKGRKIESVEPGKHPRPNYFNTGCGIYEDGITGIELADDRITLVKWHRDPEHPEQKPYVISYGDADLNDVLRMIATP
jgi:UDP-2,3-diacylglucosamine pyrophosphatase LpxH